MCEHGRCFGTVGRDRDMPSGRFRLRSAVSAINNHIGARAVAAGIRSKIEVYSLELIGLTLAPHGDLVFPGISNLLRDEIGDLRRHVSWRDRIDTCKLDPLNRDASTEVDDGSLRSIIRRLQLRDIDNMPTHAGSGDETPAPELNLIAIDVRLLLPLAPEVRASSMSRVIRSIHVYLHNLLIMVDLPVEHGALGPGDARVGNEDVEAAIEFLDDRIDGFLDVLSVDDIYLVCLAFHAELLGDPLGSLNSFLIAIVPDGDISTSFSQSLSDGKTDPSPSAGYNGSATFQREKGHDTFALWRGSVLVGEIPTLHRVSGHFDSNA